MESLENLLPNKCAADWHVVLGSGFGRALDRLNWSLEAEIPFSMISGLSVSRAPDHAGSFRLYTTPQGRTVLFQMGRLHGYEGHSARQAVAPVMLSRAAGTRNFLLTNAAGGLRPWHQLGDVMLIRDHVNLTSQNPLVGTTPVRFPDMSGAYDREWRQSLMQKFKDVGLVVHEGIYLGLLGPSFETPAEIELFSKWGIDAVGMSTVWEAIALKDSGARFAALSLISNAAAGLGDGLPLEHEKILEVCRSSAERVVLAIAAWLESERA